MRFSPVLLAALTASAAFGLAHPAEAQTSDAGIDTETVIRSEIPPDDVILAQEAIADAQPGVDRLSTGVVAPMVSAPEYSSVEFLSQAPEELSPEEAIPEEAIDEQIDETEETINEQLEEPPPELPGEPGQPPPGTQTPEQDTPDQIDIVPPQSDVEIEEDVQEEVEDQTPDQTPSSPTTPPASPTPPPPSSTEPEPRVLVAEVVVAGAEGELQDIVYQAIQTQPGRTTTRSQLQEDINSIFATGFFSSVRAIPEDTPLGVRVTFEVAPNPVLQSVQLQGSALETINYDGAEVPIQQAVDDIFSPQYGEILNLRNFQTGIDQLNQLYQSNGYVLAQVIGAPQISPDGVVMLQVAEGVIEDIQVRFRTRDGETVDEEGNPIEGRTRDFIVTREFESQPGTVFNQNQIQADLQRAFALGIFEDLSISLNPGQDPAQVEVIVNVTERRTGTFGAGVGVSSASGLFGTASLQEQNLGGNNQRLNAEIQIGERDLLFDISFTDPWIGGDPNRTSYTVNAFGRQSRSLVFEGEGDDNIRLPNGDRPRVRRFGGGVSFSRPLRDGWRATVGAQYQRVSIVDLDGDVTPRSEFGTPLSFNDSGEDDITSLQFSVSQDRRNDPLQTTSGSFLRFSTEQTIPIGNGSITFNRLRASYSYFLPVRVTDFTPGCQEENPTPNQCPQTIAVNVQGGTIIGDLPPYEAFSIGGTDSVRGYGPGEVGSGRSYFQATVEYRFPVFSIISGALFADVGTTLGTEEDVEGEPSVILDEPGFGFGYGIGVRVQSPLGQIRVDYAVNDEGDGQFHFGIGERF
ncbi:MAG: BamA/TamA family outer membrane protein [Cyanobacteria bacterium CRU_2_1]|nr:BamA/TamA family outer membrane protein [Cyanobacteria bacterium RU_5_0]NJR57594.1 BamA/TamA family outer membrane protein [Cyanobacteria bacterium CRU_2_1]